MLKNNGHKDTINPVKICNFNRTAVVIKNIALNTKKITLILNCIIGSVLCVSCSMATENTEVPKLNKIEIDGATVKYVMDSTSTFNNVEPNSNHDSLITIMGIVYENIQGLFDSKVLNGNINNLYLRVRKDTCWIIDTDFVLPPDQVMTGNCATYYITNNGKIILTVIGE